MKNEGRKKARNGKETVAKEIKKARENNGKADEEKVEVMRACRVDSLSLCFLERVQSKAIWWPNQPRLGVLLQAVIMEEVHGHNRRRKVSFTRILFTHAFWAMTFSVERTCKGFLKGGWRRGRKCSWLASFRIEKICLSQRFLLIASSKLKRTRFHLSRLSYIFQPNLRANLYSTSRSVLRKKKSMTGLAVMRWRTKSILKMLMRVNIFQLQIHRILIHPTVHS